MIEYDTLTYTKVEVSNDLLQDFEEDGFTYLHCIYNATSKYINGGWVNMHKTSYLESDKSKVRLQMLNAIGVPLAPNKHHFNRVGEYLKFTLIFPAIPKDWKIFDLIEDCSGSNGFYIKNIPRNSTGVYKVIIQ